MGIIIVRALVLILSGLAGYIVFLRIPYTYPIIGALVGLGIGLLAILFELLIRRQTVKAIIGGTAGFIAGLVAGNLLTFGVLKELLKEPYISLTTYLTINMLLGYLGIVIGSRKGIEFSFGNSKGDGAKAPGSSISYKILDTSVIIDGRIADVCETSFIEGIFVVPQFVLLELQYIADSADPLKRTRGRRGLDILKRMQKMTDLEIQVTEQDFPKVKGVDSKLIVLAKQMNAKIITNDFNLNKVAELQGVTVLNLNQLSNALKPIVIPGEFMKLKVIKEGSEANQGIAYLDDGTMVVVDNGRKLIGKTIDTVVTSVLQTTAGRMIFVRPKEENGGFQHQ